MSAFHKFTLLSQPLAALALLASAGASAETLIYVTADSIGTVDSSSAAADDTAGGGPLRYALPGGFSVIGAEVSPETQTLYLLADDSGGSCQLFSVDTSGGGSAGVAAVGMSYSCTLTTGSGDFAFLNGSGGGSGADAYVIAGAEQVLYVPPGGGAPTGDAITTPGGGEANIQGIVDVGTYPDDTQYGVDASTQQLVELQLKLGSSAEKNLGSVSSAQFFGRTSLDYSTQSGDLYLYTDGQLYSLVLSSFSATAEGTQDVVNALGAAPAGTLAVAVANGATVSNNGGGGGGGAFAPCALLPLLSAAFLRRRRRIGRA